MTRSILNFFRRKKSGKTKVALPITPNANPRRQSPESESDVHRPIQLVIGLDFGTSFSKVVVGESRMRYAVPFEDYAGGKNPYFLPTLLYVSKDTNLCSLKKYKSDDVVYDNLKMPLIERDFSVEVQARAVAFLALLLNHTRSWLFSNYASVYKHRRIEWFVNVGLPTDSFNEEKLSSVYQSIVRAAWCVSETESAMTLTNATKFVKQSGGIGSSLADNRINVFPEFSAQYTGYVRSPRRKSGLHIGIDVGGGTFDVTVFNVHRNDDEDIFPIFCTKVKPLGVRFLVRSRVQALSHDSVFEISPFIDLPSDNDFAKLIEIPLSKLESIDAPFRQQIQSIIGKAINKSNKIYPTASEWCPGSVRYDEPVPAFFCGGGAFAEFYTSLLSEFESRDPPYKFSATRLPVPEDLYVPMPDELDSLTAKQQNYLRLAVAYGLSFDPFDITRIITVNNNQYPEHKVINFRNHFVGAEHT